MAALLSAVIIVWWWSVHLCLAQVCSRTPPSAPEVDCSIREAGECFLNVNETIPDPEPNTRSCYRTCIRPDGPFNICEVDGTPPFENLRLVRQEGPRERRVYGKFRVFSPNFRRRRPYLNNEFCRQVCQVTDFHLFCADRQPDSILTINIQTVTVEEQRNCDADIDPQCVDGIRLRLPYGNTCTLCGSGPLVCEEVPNGRELPQTLSFDGNASLIVEFQANRLDRFEGFQFLTNCVPRSYFSQPGCTSPDTMPGKRDAELTEGGMFREIRGSRVAHIIVRPDSAVSYSDYIVHVFRGEEYWLFKFPNIRYFQVFNFAEGFQTFCGSAPEGRIFPGFGWLKIGKGIIQYIQTGVSTRFLPSPAEVAIIVNLQRRIVEGIDELDVDISDAQDGPPGEPGTAGPGFTPAEIAEMNAEASANDNACNGILRSTSCEYQDMFFPGGAGPNCLIGLPP